MDSSDVQVRIGVADDWEAVADLVGHAFHQPYDQVWRDAEGSVYEPERSLIADDAGQIVGHASAYTRELSVPGAVVPAAHVTQVSVAPTHRRRGLLSRMMRRQLGEIAADGREAVAVLWASEGKIYPRFGYGLAAQHLNVDVMTREIRLTDPAPATPAARLRLVQPGEAVAELAKVYEQLRPDRPGWSSRDDRWWQYVLADPESQRHGATALHGVVADTADGPTGYALWRGVSRWDGHGPDGEVRIREVVAADPATYATLWRFLLSIDLTRKATAGFLPLDEPLQHLVDEPRRLGARVSDGLWIRLVDLPRALAARRYATDVDVVLEVSDDLLAANTGQWRLTAGPGGATCTRSTDPADLACTVLELGAAYLGGTSLAALGAAGRVRELTPGALAAASTAFGWHRLPHATEVF
ncbi:putative acetyltransferase [Krasilnikovia cinnamomea]|uniref:Putative acetyltransferase n=1 Tax=Krasilnikovia cinnamomea TaxID=349313 RepID=A0A4Q7ZQ71_9ACTN|nr:GNAT family N-acetyltransferase [Krasilnikovia cinnamomea]RZU52509.1 putative acetyltransferase [Krasilnikovia cinnamomea]